MAKGNLLVDSMSNIPSDLKYTDSHEWIKVSGEMATVGITDFAQSELGDVVYVDLPTVGRIVAKGDVFGSVESVKTVSDIYAPVSGEVVAINEALVAQSELVNSAPYDSGYLVQIKISNPEELKNLIDSATYSAMIN